MVISKTSDSPNSLKKSPTIFGWVVELQRILNGEREVSLLKLQNVVAYIEKILERSDDVALARACFQQALSDVVQNWQPNDRSSKEFLACMLDILVAYTPREGASKILGLLGRWRRFPPPPASAEGYGADSDLNLKAFVTLEGYFPVAPHVDLKNWSLDFQKYVDILLENLMERRYGGYVSGRLIDLGVLSFEDDKIGDVIKANPEGLYELVSLLLAPARRSRVQRDYKLLLDQVVNAPEDTRQLLKRILHVNKVRVVDDDAGSFIIGDDWQDEVPTRTAAADEDTNGGRIVDPIRLNKQINYVPELLRRGDEEAREIISTTFEACLLAGRNWIDQFSSKLRLAGWSLEHDEFGVNIVDAGDQRFRASVSSQDLLVRYMGWYSWRQHLPVTSEMLDHLEAAAGG